MLLVYASKTLTALPSGLEVIREETSEDATEKHSTVVHCERS
jgi:hypothetical protein